MVLLELYLSWRLRRVDRFNVLNTSEIHLVYDEFKKYT